MKKKFCARVFGKCLTIFLGIFSKAPSDVFALIDEKIMFIGQDTKTIQEYVRDMKMIPAGFMVYTSVQDMDGLDIPCKDYGGGIHHADLLLHQYPDSMLQIGLYMVGALKDTYLGKYDSNLTKLATYCKKVKNRIYLRIGYEFDGPHNGYDPLDFKKAYMHVVQKLNSEGVNNVFFVWHSYSSQGSDRLSDWYPGDAFVDWVGLTYFDQPEDLMKPVIRFANEHNKPLMIGEATPRGVGSGMDKLSWEAWYKLFFNFIDRNDIRIVSYINGNWEELPMWQNQGWGDARVQANKYVKEKWITEMQKDVFKNSWKPLN